MPKWMHVDTTGLEEKMDVADLLATGMTKSDLTKWLKTRIKPGPPPAHVKPVESKPKKVKKKLAKKPVPAPVEPENEGNVTALRKPEPEPDYGFPPEFSEDSLAEKFTDAYHETMVYCGSWGKWMEWDNAKWTADESHAAIDRARKIIRIASNEINDRIELGDKRVRMRNAISTHKTMSNIERIARTDRRHAITPSEFDADPWSLNTPDGIVNLRTGDLRPATRDDFVSKVTAVGPGGKCPIWMNYLKEATNGDEELESYLKRVAGYCLTGSIAEHAFFFCYGTGGNGKGIYKEMLDWMLNSYSRVANIDTFTEQRFNRHSSDIAFFQGARLVTSTEPGEGSRWAEGKIKAMTGGDPITANHMHQNPFTFAPLFKLLFTGNFRPQLRSVDRAIRRRLYLIPFENEVPDECIDLQLPEKIRQPEEARGILEWMIEGCLEWQSTMLRPPARVIASTADYLESEDRIGRFLEENVTVGKTLRIKTSLIYAKYKYWADTSNEYAVSLKRFKDLLANRGYLTEKRGGDMVIMGLGDKGGLLGDERPPPERGQY